MIHLKLTLVRDSCQTISLQNEKMEFSGLIPSFTVLSLSNGYSTPMNSECSRFVLLFCFSSAPLLEFSIKIAAASLWWRTSHIMSRGLITTIHIIIHRISVFDRFQSIRKKCYIILLTVWRLHVAGQGGKEVLVGSGLQNLCSRFSHIYPLYIVL